MTSRNIISRNDLMPSAEMNISNSRNNTYSFFNYSQQYKDDHNKIAYLGRERGCEDFTDILRYLDHSPLRYALTHAPPVVFDSLVKHQARLFLFPYVEDLRILRFLPCSSPSYRA
ncbi:hypothetical protein Tco_0565498 [Tanacetum coccineum]